MKEYPRQKLVELVAQYGVSLCDDPERCAGLLKDYCPDCRKETNVLVTALNERVTAELRHASATIPLEITLSRLSNRLQDNQGLEINTARWAVETWALALGKINMSELSKVDARARKPEPSMQRATQPIQKQQGKLSNHSVQPVSQPAKGTTYQRRFPVYLVMDTSAAMAGSPIVSMREGLRTLVDNLMSEPMAMEQVFLSVITFNDRAQQVVPLTDLINFKEPIVRAGGAVALGAALNLLQKCMDREIVKQTWMQRGDYKPLVFLFIADTPTDDWEKEAEKLNQQRLCQIIVIIMGGVPDERSFKRFTKTVLLMRDMTAVGLKQFFRWESQL